MFTLALDRYGRYVSHILTCFYRFYTYIFLDVFKVFLTCILSILSIVLTIMDFKISDTNSGKKSLLHNGYSYRIDAVL